MLNPYRNLESYGFWLLCLTVLLLPFPRFLPYWTLILFLLAGLIEWVKRYNEIIPSFKKDIKYLAGPVLFFFLNLIWTIVQKPTIESYSDSFLFFLVPVLGYPLFISPLLNRKRHIAFKYFIYGILMICLYEFSMAFINSLHFEEGKMIFNPEIDHETAGNSIDYLSSKSRFRSFGLVKFSHPYFLAFEVLLAIYLLFNSRKSIGLRKPWFLMISLVLMIYLYLISSRSSFIAAALIIICTLYLQSIRMRKLWVFYAAVPIVLAGLVFISLSNPRIKKKTDYLIEQVRTKPGNLEDADPRLLAWITSYELIKEYPLTGLGLAARDSLYSRYIKNGYSYGAKLQINPHSQFLESQLSFGIPGTLVLLLLLFMPVIRKPPGMNAELFNVFLIIVITGCLFASFLVNSWGSLFFILFYCIIVLGREDRKNIPADDLKF